MKVTLVMAVTLDGKIAKHENHFADWTEKEDKLFFQKHTTHAGVLIMGSRTFDTIGRPLPNRKNIVMTKKTDRVSDNPDLEFSNEPPKKILQQLENEGFQEVVIAGGSKINTLFAKEKLITDVMLTISPVIFGTGMSLFDTEIGLQLELKDTQKLGLNSVLLHYQVL